ncbi:hypothetical protein GLOIN_2v1769145 [Rhizophagus irregularis DAOM 181602=DAOM 197198]|nr:hypothetical protein GLOIN_2v1769145 [Rhizophagus irregularis DAOM 181602=DAOM 197198]
MGLHKVKQPLQIRNMSSTPLIELDWSSTPQHSYVQLGDPTPPENNSDDISYNTERPVIFSTKDILSLDIDDIYPYTHSTLHFEDNETEYIYDDEDYFQQLLQAHLNAEIEEGSVLRDDKPLIDNTPLTPIQEINPIPPLDTAPLLDNLPIVENINPIPLDTAPLLEILPMNYEIHRSGSSPPFSSTFEYSFSTKKINPYEVRDTRGSGTLYNTKKGRYFLIELDNSSHVDLRKKNFFNVCTNDIQLSDDHHRIFNSNCKKLNLNYLIGTYLTFVFTLNKQFSPAIVDKYFHHLRQLLLDKILAVKNRTSSISNKNRQTKTFIRFSSGPHVIYLGYYFACGFTENNKCCQQPAAVVLSHNRLNCNKHLPKFIIHGRFRTGILPQNPSFLAHNRYQTHNHAKEVHSTRLGISYNVITRRYNEWRGKQDFYLKNVMEPLSTKTKKGVNTTRTFYKEYYNFELDANRTQQQIKRWNRLKFSNFKAERSLGQVRPFLINEHSHVYKKIQHAVERFPPYSRKSKLEIESDKIIRKRTKNWKRRTKMRNKKRKPLPPLPDNFTGKAISYYFNTHNINLAAYKVRRRYNLSGIPDYKFGYLKAVRRYGKYQNRLRSPPPPIVEDKTIDTNTQPEATFFSDKLTLNSHKAHFARTTPTGHQYPSTPEPDPLKSIKDDDQVLLVHRISAREFRTSSDFKATGYWVAV